MARKPAAPKAATAKKNTGSLWGALLGVALVFAAFFFGAQYFTAKRSTTATVCATSLGKEFVTVYRLPSGSLDKYSPDDATSTTVSVPVAAQVTVVNADKKRVKVEAFVIEPSSPKTVIITINPQGKVSKIQEIPGAFKVEGIATVKSKREIAIGKDSYFIGGTLVLSAGNLTANAGDDLEGTVETGDVVTLTGHGDEVAVLDIKERAGKVAVSSNVEGARVYVDGALRGKSPLVLTVAPGTREVLVKADGYSEKRLTVDVLSLVETPVTADLTEVTGTLSVSTKPAGATVTVSGDDKGVTPLKLPLKPGLYEVQVELQGYYLKKAEVVIAANTEQPLAFSLVKKPGSQTGDSEDEGDTPGTPQTQYKYTEKGVVLARTGASLLIGDRWSQCVLSSDVVAMDAYSIIPAGQIEPGDTVTVYGDSASAIKLVKLEQSLPDRWPFEGFLVRTGSGYRVFGDESTLQVEIPDNLVIIDPANKTKDPVASVPQGSRIKFFVDSRGQAVWAEYVWRAGASADGTLGSMSGAVFRVTPGWEDMQLSTFTVVYVDTRRSDFYDVKMGDSVVASGPFAKDIRFVWVRSRSASTTQVQAVAVSGPGKSGKMLQEYRGGSLQGYPITAGSDVQLSYAAERRTIPASDLQYGDRVMLWLDENRRVVAGEVLLKNDFQVSGIFLGEEDGLYYFTGFRPYAPAEDLLVTGLAPGEDLEPGSKVLAAGAAGIVNYVEVQSEATSTAHFTGTVLGSKDALHLRKDTGGLVSYNYGKDTWFADWITRQDGLISTLFPGERVTVALGYGGTVVWAERVYVPQFKLEGTIEAISWMDRTIVVGDKTSRKTITLADAVTFMKDGESTGIFGLAVGDKVKVSGRDKANVDMVIVGW